MELGKVKPASSDQSYWDRKYFAEIIGRKIVWASEESQRQPVRSDLLQQWGQGPDVLTRQHRLDIEDDRPGSY